MNILKNRPVSFIILLAVYIIATVAGIYCYNFVTAQYALGYRLALLVADVFATVVTFIFSIIFRNASVYDPYWSVQPVVIVLAFVLAGNGAAHAASAANSPNVFTVVLITAICYWGARLTANWAYCFGDLTCQDWRYTMLHEKCGIFYPLINFVGIHMVPTLVVYLCTLPAVVYIKEGTEFSPLSFVLAALSFIAPTIQLVADIQMQKFRRNKTGPFIRKGLWKHARHPNYFGEILMWWGIGLSCFVSMGFQWYLLCGAIANTLLFLCVSIPMAEKRQSKKEGFAQYKKETRILI